jgi:MoaA/NifB/PqqE/SkfB family radical SAM enzyme
MSLNNLSPEVLTSSAIFSEYDFSKIPFERIVRLGQRSMLYRNLFSVSWLLGRYCNYKCSYCWPYARSDERDHRPTSLILSTIDEIKRQARKRGFNSFHFSFSGGEPTMHPGYLKILEHYSSDSKSNYLSAHMTTNLSAGLGWLRKYVQATKSLHRLSVTASFHKEFANPEQFQEKLQYLQSEDIQVTINMVMVPERFDTLWEDALGFQRAGINVTLKPQSNQSATKVVSGYSSEQILKLQAGLPQRDFTKSRMNCLNKVSIRPKYANLSNLNNGQTNLDSKKIPQIMQVEFTDDLGENWFMDQAERFNSFGFNQFKGWDCSAGYRSIIIREPDGSIKRSYSCRDEPLGNLDTGFNLFNKIEPCITDTCVSSADSKIPKRKAGSAQPLWPGDETFKA